MNVNTAKLLQLNKPASSATALDTPDLTGSRVHMYWWTPHLHQKPHRTQRTGHNNIHNKGLESVQNIFANSIRLAPLNLCQTGERRKARNNIYRSPSSATDNNNALCKLIKDIDSRSEHFKVILGDFNYPSITWNDLHYEATDNNESRDPDTFKEAIIESYLNQLVDFATRSKGTENLSCIDWVFTNNEALINGVTDGSPLGSNDHTLIEVDIHTTPKDNWTHYKKYYYDKGNYTAMREFVAEKSPRYQTLKIFRTCGHGSETSWQ